MRQETRNVGFQAAPFTLDDWKLAERAARKPFNWGRDVARDEVRTSQTDPIKVDWLPLNGPGHVGMTFCPGRRQRSIGQPIRWERSLIADMAELAAMGASTLVTLLEDEDFRRVGLGSAAVFRSAAMAEGLEVLRFPIVDGGTPTTARMRSILAAIARARRARRPVVIHCAAGLGRTGLVAGCLLKREGFGSAAALATLERLRGPRCPENAMQRAMVYAWR